MTQENEATRAKALHARVRLRTALEVTRVLEASGEERIAFMAELEDARVVYRAELTAMARILIELLEKVTPGDGHEKYLQYLNEELDLALQEEMPDASASDEAPSG